MVTYGYLCFLDRNLRDVFSQFFYDSKIFSQNSQVVAYGIFLPVSRIVLFESFSGTPRFSTDFSQFSQFFCSLVELRTFSVKKNSDFLAAAYLQNVFSQFLQVSFICYCCAVADGRINLLTFLWDVLKTLMYSFAVLPRLSCFSSGWKFTKLEMCLLLILLDMTNINEEGGELFDDVVPGDGLDSRAFLKPEIVRVSWTNLK